MAAETFTYSGNVYTAGVAGTTDFALISSAAKAIEYLEPSHIHVYTSTNDGASWTELTRPAQWDFISSGTSVRLALGIAAGTWVKVQRITPSDGQYVTFQPSSQLVAEQLNDDTLFNTYLNQERLDESVRSNLLSLEAIDTATAASSAAAAAASDATSALQASSSAVQDASAALSAASAASSNASAAVSTANAAAGDAAVALSASAAASANASDAVATANTADSKASQALAAVSEALFYEVVANVAAIPGTPADGDAIEVADSTGIELFSPLSNLPQGFVGDSGLSVRLVYQSTGASWLWAQYYPRDPDNRYLNPSDQAALDALIGAAQADATQALSDAAAAQSSADAAASVAASAQSAAQQADAAAQQADATAQQALAASVFPAGTVIYHAGTSAPAGWLKADGSLVSRTTYANLFAAIGTLYGAGNGSTTFALPDLRGEFIRGWDDGRGVDPGRVLGSAQTHALQSHAHSYLKESNGFAASGGGANVSGSSSSNAWTTSMTGNGADETRPRNIALLACIKF